MKKWKRFLFPLCLAPRAAFALCANVSIQGLPATATFQSPSGEYAVFDAAEHMQTVSFSVAGDTFLGACQYFVTLSPGNAGPGQRELRRGADHLNYNVYTSAAKTNILKDTASAGGAAEVITGSFAGGTNNANPHAMHWTINPLQIVKASATRFEDISLDVKLYEGILGLVFVPTQTKTITFRAKAESSVDISLVDAAGAFSAGDTVQAVDFGDLASGESLSFDAVVRSNDGYRVTLESKNASQMKHLTETATIPYTLTFGGVSVDLSSGAAVQAAASSGAVTPAAGTRFSTAFTVGALSGSEPAGNYQDDIIVTVAAH